MKIEPIKVKLFDVLRRIQVATEDSISNMAEMLQQQGQITPITITMVGEDPYLLHGYRRLMAAIKLGWDDIKYDPVPCAPEHIIFTAITAGNQDEKTYVRLGAEVKLLKEWTENNLPELQDGDPELKRSMTKVAQWMGFKSKDTAYKLLKITEAPTGMYCLNELDSGELKSLQSAYEKALGIVKTPPARKPLSANCAPCEFFKDNDGNICPRHIWLKDDQGQDFWGRLGNSKAGQHDEDDEPARGGDNE